MVSAVLGNSPEALRTRYSMAYFHARSHEFHDASNQAMEPTTPKLITIFPRSTRNSARPRSWRLILVSLGHGDAGNSSPNTRPETHRSRSAGSKTFGGILPGGFGVVLRSLAGCRRVCGSSVVYERTRSGFVQTEQAVWLAIPVAAETVTEVAIAVQGIEI